MGTLTSAARERLGDVFVASEAARIDRANGWTVTTEAGEERADAVVVATDASAAASLVADVAPDAVAPLRTIRYSPLAVAHWAAPDAALPHGFGWLAPNDEKRGVLGTIFVSDLFPDRAPPGQRTFATMLGGTRAPADADLDVEAMTERIRAEHLALTGKPVTIARIEVSRHPRAVAIPAPGHPDRIEAIRRALPKGIAVAGAWCGGAAMNDAVESGFAAADSLLGGGVGVA
jgi:oxygen-dependent protoporphyrinogen oxidase